jgi:addiction module RelB/DinJ family antitoxin
MPATALVQARIEPELKDEVHSLLEELGLDHSTFIRMAYKNVARNQRLPEDFTIKWPNYRSIDDLTPEEIKAHSTKDGEWIFDEYEGEFLKPEIVKKLNHYEKMIKEGREDELHLTKAMDIDEALQYLDKVASGEIKI